MVRDDGDRVVAWVGKLVLATCLMWMAGTATRARADDPPGGANDESSAAEIKDAEGSGNRTSRWIGVQLGNVPEMLQEHLRLDKKGAIVLGVLPESPAEKTNLEVYDVIVRVDDHDVVGPSQMSELVESSKGNLRLKIIHKGESKDIEVQPVEWPKELAGKQGGPTAAEFLNRLTPDDVVRLRLLLDGDPIRIRSFGPAVLPNAKVLGEFLKSRRGAGKSWAEKSEVKNPEEVELELDLDVAGDEDETDDSSEPLADRLGWLKFHVRDGEREGAKPEADEARWQRIEKSLDRLTEVLDRLEKKLDQ